MSKLTAIEKLKKREELCDQLEQKVEQLKKLRKTYLNNFEKLYSEGEDILKELQKL